MSHTVKKLMWHEDKLNFGKQSDSLTEASCEDLKLQKITSQ